MAISNSYVKLPEGNQSMEWDTEPFFQTSSQKNDPKSNGFYGSFPKKDAAT